MQWTNYVPLLNLELSKPLFDLRNGNSRTFVLTTQDTRFDAIVLLGIGPHQTARPRLIHERISSLTRACGHDLAILLVRFGNLARGDGVRCP